MKNITCEQQRWAMHFQTFMPNEDSNQPAHSLRQPIQDFCRHPAKTPIRLHGRAGYFESSMGTRIWKYILSRSDSYPVPIFELVHDVFPRSGVARYPGIRQQKHHCLRKIERPLEWKTVISELETLQENKWNIWSPPIGFLTKLNITNSKLFNYRNVGVRMWRG